MVENTEVKLEDVRKIPRITKTNIMEVMLSDNYNVYMVLSAVEKPFLNNPMLWMHRQGRDIVDNFNLLALHSFLLKEYSPSEYEDSISDIAEQLDVIHGFMSSSIVESRDISKTDLTIYTIVPNKELFKKNHVIISKAIPNLFLARRKDGD